MKITISTKLANRYYSHITRTDKIESIHAYLCDFAKDNPDLLRQLVFDIFDDEFQILYKDIVDEKSFSEVEMPDDINILIQEIIDLKKLSKEITASLIVSVVDTNIHNFIRMTQ